MVVSSCSIKLDEKEAGFMSIDLKQIKDKEYIFILFKRLLRALKRDKALLLIISPVLLYYAIFHYIPMYGITIAFKSFTLSGKLFEGTWVGFKYFKEFFSSVYIWRLLRNTILISLYSILWSFPVPILFALALNEIKQGFFKRFVQTVSYLPHFISVVIVIGMLIRFVSPRDGVINMIIKLLGHKGINFMNEPKYFRTMYITTGIWQSFGWNSIIYIAALTGIDPQLYEAAIIDGANRIKKIINITIPCILPTIIILLILALGGLFSVGFEKIILMYNPVTYEVADVISTYTYRRGILDAQYSFGAAVGLFNSAINFIILLIFNSISKKVTNIALW
jgi:putative aldouronate transport system permease protein